MKFETIERPQVKPRLMSKEELTKLIDQKSQDIIGRNEPTIKGSRTPIPNMTMLGVESESMYSSTLRFAPDTIAWFARSSARLLPSSVDSQVEVTMELTHDLISPLNLLHLSPRF